MTTLSQSHEENGNTVSTQISEIHQKLKEFEEGAFFKSPPKANPVVQQLQKQIAELIKQMEESFLNVFTCVSKGEIFHINGKTN